MAADFLCDATSAVGGCGATMYELLPVSCGSTGARHPRAEMYELFAEWLWLENQLFHRVREISGGNAVAAFSRQLKPDRATAVWYLGPQLTVRSKSGKAALTRC